MIKLAGLHQTLRRCYLEEPVAAPVEGWEDGGVDVTTVDTLKHVYNVILYFTSLHRMLKVLLCHQ